SSERMMRRGAGSFKLTSLGSQETRRSEATLEHVPFLRNRNVLQAGLPLPHRRVYGNWPRAVGAAGASHEPSLPCENIVRRALRRCDPLDDIAVGAELRAGPRRDRRPKWSAACTGSSSSPSPAYEAGGAYRLRYPGRPCLP